MTLLHVAGLIAAAVGGGLMNAMAGGGTLLTFPALVLLGLPAIQANATSTIALWPGAAASMFGYRREVAANRRWLKTLFLPSLAGGALGSVLLLATPEKAFDALAPFLVLAATLLFMLQGAVARWSGGAQDRRRGLFGWAVAWLFQFGVAVYGGYFGAGIGILMLAVLGFLGLSDIHAANGLKNFFNMCINGVAAAYFIARGAVHWPEASVMIVGAIVGGYGGAHFARSIGKSRARAAVIAIGFLATAILVWEKWR